MNMGVRARALLQVCFIKTSRTPSSTQSYLRSVRTVVLVIDQAN